MGREEDAGAKCPHVLNKISLKLGGYF
jgi:hypothetical protein